MDVRLFRGKELAEPLLGLALGAAHGDGLAHPLPRLGIGAVGEPEEPDAWPARDDGPLPVVAVHWAPFPAGVARVGGTAGGVKVLVTRQRS